MDHRIWFVAMSLSFFHRDQVLKWSVLLQDVSTQNLNQWNQVKPVWCFWCCNVELCVFVLFTSRFSEVIRSLSLELEQRAESDRAVRLFTSESLKLTPSLRPINRSNPVTEWTHEQSQLFKDTSDDDYRLWSASIHTKSLLNPGVRHYRHRGKL